VPVSAASNGERDGKSAAAERQDDARARLPRLATRRAREADAHERYGTDDQNRFDAGNLFSRVEHGEQEKTGESTGKRRGRDFSGHNGAAARALVRIGQMPLAAGTGRHQKQAASRQESNTRRFYRDPTVS
jgi:hypothetical protein